MQLNEKGQCPICKRKPIVYKTNFYTKDGPEKFCTRCCRSFDIETGDQKENWYWKKTATGFERKR
uniref:Uncharacterized protein n=1 Tax=viral metagenome TaxID=1070528 RepID=A0A6H1ZXR0_9ZZZZ